MALKVSWSKEALNELAATITYLKNTWGKQSVKKFSTKLEKCVSLIAVNPFMAQSVENEPFTRRCVVTKQNSLFYKIDIITGQVLITSLFDTRQDPKKRRRY